MNDLPPESRPDPDHTQSLPDQPGEASTPTTTLEPAKQRLRDRLWSFRAVIAVALASVIVGGLGGAALASVSQGDDERHFGPGQGRFNRGGPNAPGGMMDDRRRERMEQWRDQGGTGQRQWGQNGMPGVPPSGLPKPTKPTPPRPTPIG